MASVVRLEQKEFGLVIGWNFPAVSLLWLSIGCHDEVSRGKQRLKLSCLPNDSLCTVVTGPDPDMRGCNDMEAVDCELSQVSLHCIGFVN